MPYILAKSINLSLKNVVTGNNTQEYLTNRATNGILNHYFTSDRFRAPPEQIQKISGKNPDYSVEIIDHNENFVLHFFT